MYFRKYISIILIITYLTGCSYTYTISSDNPDKINSEIHPGSVFSSTEIELMDNRTFSAEDIKIENDSLYYTSPANDVRYGVNLLHVKSFTKYEHGTGCLDGFWISTATIVAAALGLGVYLENQRCGYCLMGLAGMSLYALIVGVPASSIIGGIMATKYRYELKHESDKSIDTDFQIKDHPEKRYVELTSQDIKMRTVIVDEILEETDTYVKVLFGGQRIKLPTDEVKIFYLNDEIRIKIKEKLFREKFE